MTELESQTQAPPRDPVAAPPLAPPRAPWWQGAWVQSLLAYMFYVALAGACLRPLFPLVEHHLLGAEHSDALRNVWGFWWVWEMLSSGYLPRFTTYLNYPQGMTILVIDPLNCLASIPFQLVFGLPTGYNYFMVATLAFGAWGGYMLARDRFGSAPAALVAGAIYGLCPFVYSNAVAGTSEVVNVGWMPLYLRALFHLLDSSDGAPLWGRRAPWVKAGLLLVCVTLSSWYYGYILGVATLLLLGWWGVGRLRARKEILPAIKQLALHGVIFAVVTGLMIYAWRDIIPSVQRGAIPREKQLEVLAGNSVNLWEVWEPSPERWHRPSLYHLPPELIVAAPVLLVIGAPAALQWGLPFLVFLMLSVSLRPQTAPFSLPDSLLEVFFSFGDLSGKFYLLFLDHFPMGGLIRFPYRYLVIVNLSLAMIVAAGLARLFGVGRLTRGVGQVAGVVGAALMAGRMIMVGHYYETPQTTLVSPPKYVDLLAADPDDVGMAQLPLNLSGGRQTFYQIYHHKRLFTFIDFVTSRLHYLPGNMLPISYVQTLFSIHQRGWDERVQGFPTHTPEWPSESRVVEDMQMLARARCRYVAIEEGRFKPEDVLKIRELLDPHLQLIIQDDAAQVRLYRIRDSGEGP